MSRGILRNSTYFPTFSNLPDENDTKDERRSRNETWCTLAEIVEDKMAFCWRHVVKVKDKNGYLFTVAFYVDNDDGPMPVNYQLYQGFNITGRWSSLQNGSTICIRYAEKRQFLDSSEGVRVENLDTVKVIPLSLNELLRLSDDKPEARINAVTSTCWKCNTPAAAKCGRCKLAVYCSKECQTTDWVNKHKKCCKILPDYMDLISYETCAFRRALS